MSKYCQKRKERTDYEGFYGQDKRANQKVYSKESIDPATKKLTIFDAINKSTHQRVVM